MKRYTYFIFSLALILSSALSFTASAQRTRILAFYSTKGEADHVDFAKELRAYLFDLGVEKGITIDATTDWTNLNTNLLKNYQAVIFINDIPKTTVQRTVFQQYMEAGGGWVGFHAAGYTDKSTNWPWYTAFLGGAVYHNNVWPPLKARMLVDDMSSPIAKRIPPAYSAPADEWYQWQPSPRANKDVKVLVTMDPLNYPIGMRNIIEKGDVPVVWTNTRYNMVYMSIGHSGQSVSDHLQNFMITDAILMVSKKK